MTKFLALLKSAGVKKVIVGGAELIVDDGKVENCVGNFIDFFKFISEHGYDLDMELKVSEGTIPHGRKELRNSNRIDLL